MNALTSRIAVACYAAAVILFGLAADTVWGALFPGPNTARSMELLKDVPTSTSVIAAKAKIEDYAAIKSDRFMNPPPPPPPEQPRVEQPAQSHPPQGGPNAAYVLKGTLCHSNPALSRAFIEVTGVEDERAYRIGDVINGAKIVAIGERTAVCSRGEGSFTLAVRFDDVAGPGQGPAADEGKGENRQARENRQGNPQAAEKREAREEKREAREEKREEKAAQPQAETKTDAWENLPARLRERLQSLNPEERARYLRMAPAERAEFFRSRRAQENAGKN